jgi:hypothetical protein
METLLVEMESGEVYRFSFRVPLLEVESCEEPCSPSSNSRILEFAAGNGKRGSVTCYPSSVSWNVEWLLLEEESSEVYRALLPDAAPWYISNVQIQEDLEVTFFAEHIRALTESYGSKLAGVGNPLVLQLGRYLR